MERSLPIRILSIRILSGSRPTVRCAVRTTLLLVAALVLGTRAASTAQAVSYVPADRGKDVNPDTPMFYADCVGLRAVLDRGVEFHREVGSRWTPVPLLVCLAEAGGTSRELDLARRA
jgi:hypothetical protein